MDKIIDKILDKKREDQEIAELLYYLHLEKSNVMGKAIHELHKQDVVRAQRIIDLENNFDRKIERVYANYKDKILSKKYIKLIAKELVKDKECKLSQTSIMDLLSNLGISMINQVCIHEYKNVYSDDLLNLLFETMQSEKYLKQEFETFINKTLKSYVQASYIDVTDLDGLALELYAIEHGKYLAQVFLNLTDKLEEIKSKIHEILNYTKNDLQFIKNEISKKEDEFYQKMQEGHDSARNGIFNEAASDLIKKHDVLKNTFSEEELMKYIKDIIVDEREYNIDRVVIAKKFNEYFNFDSKQDEDEYYNSVSLVHRAQFEFDDLDFIKWIYIYLKDSEEKYLEKHKPEENHENTLCILFAHYFVQLLAYHIHSSFKLSDEMKKEMMNDFLQIYIRNDKCKEHFNELKELAEIPFLFKLTPIEDYYTRIIASVLFELEDKNVSQDVVKILIKYFGEIKDLTELCKEQTKIFVNEKYIDLTTRNYLNEFAISFIYYYLQDKIYMASFSPFARYAKEVLLSSVKLKYVNNDEIIHRIIHLQQTKKDKNTEEIIRIYNELNSIVKKAEKLIPDMIKDEALVNITSIVQFKGYDMSHFLNLDCFDYLVKKHETSLIRELSLYLEGPLKELYSKKNFEEKALMVWRLVMILEIINEIERANEFIPTSLDLEKDKRINELEVENDELKKRIKELESKVNGE